MDSNLNEQVESNQVASVWIATANHGFAPYAQEELRRAFGAVKSSVIVPGEVLLTTILQSNEYVIKQLQAKPLMFLRHIFPIQWQWQAGNDGGEDWMMQLVEFIKSDPRISGAKLAIQPRKTELSLWSGTSAELKEVIQEALSDFSGEIVVRDADYILSVFVTKNCVFAGISCPKDNISDWNGGAIRFRREDGQISRAKFKLLEAEISFGIDFTAFKEALDIGAAPGGWTSFLLERGLKVTAVDPARMHPMLVGMSNLTIIKKNASEIKLREHQFDLLVCDMSWSPKLTARLVSDLLYSLVPGGTAIVTVKLLGKKPMALIQEVIGIFEEARLQIQRAKQLFHNREEVTLYMIKY